MKLCSVCVPANYERVWIKFYVHVVVESNHFKIFLHEILEWQKNYSIHCIDQLTATVLKRRLKSLVASSNDV